jgi:hypothetical protein
MLSKEDLFCLSELTKRAKYFEIVAYGLNAAVEKCVNLGTIKDLDDMVAMTFNAQQFTPQYGGGAGGLPPGKYKGVIVDSSQENVEKNGVVTGGYLALHLTPIEGPLAGTKQIDRINLHNTNPKTVEIANKQLAAYCDILNTYQFNDTSELHNKPFLFEIGFQKGNEPTPEKPEGGYTEVKRILDLSEREPGKPRNAAPVAAAPVAIPDAAPAGVVAAGAGWGGAPAAAAPVAAGVDTNVAPPAAWGGAAAPAAAAPAPAPAPAAAPAGWGQAPAGGAAPAGWGAR